MAASPLRDGDIRRPLHVWLERQHEGCPNTGIIHELRIPRPSARADLAVINGEMVGYEIKSDVDSLARLPRQIRAFNNVFDRSYVVAAEKHVSNVERIIPEWWGIAVPVLDANSGSFDIFRIAQPNPEPRIDAALYMLRKAEIISILELHDCAKGARGKRHADVVSLAAGSIEETELRSCIRQVLRGRLKNGAPAHIC